VVVCGPLVCDVQFNSKKSDTHIHKSEDNAITRMHIIFRSFRISLS